MSASAESESDAMMLCASCGVAGGDDIKLKNCTACHLVKYCSVKCQKEHRSQHKKECKKRAAELRDELLFKQPEGTHLGDCPICCLPLPLDTKSALMPCCCKMICAGCDYANAMREIEERVQQKCAFCRTNMAKTYEEKIERLMKRIEANDPVALCQIGTIRRIEGDCQAAFEYWTRAAALGNAEAHHSLSVSYHQGRGVEKDEKKQLHHLKEAAIGGHPMSRHNLGCFEGRNGRLDRAAKHYIIAAKLGDDGSLSAVNELYKDGIVSNEDFASALRGHKAAIDAMKSPQREQVPESVAKKS